MNTPLGEQVAIGETTCEKDLGVKVDNKLKFKEHMNDVINKSNKMVGMIRRTFKTLSISTFGPIFKTIVRPHLEYGNTIWHPALLGDQRKIERVQRRATKLVPGMQALAYEERSKALNLPSLLYRRMRGDLIATYRILHSSHPNQLMPLAKQGRTRGHNFKLEKQPHNLDSRGHFFSLRIVNS